MSVEEVLNHNDICIKTFGQVQEASSSNTAIINMIRPVINHNISWGPIIHIRDQLCT